MQGEEFIYSTEETCRCKGEEDEDDVRSGGGKRNGADCYLRRMTKTSPGTRGEGLRLSQGRLTDGRRCDWN